MNQNPIYEYSYDKFVVNKAADSMDIFEHATRRKRAKWEIESSRAVDADELKKLYGNLMYSVNVQNVTVSCTEKDDKVSLKVFYTLRNRGFGNRFFRIRRNIIFLSYNLKTNNFYCGEINKKNKQVIQKKMYCNRFGDVGLRNILLRMRNLVKNIIIDERQIHTDFIIGGKKEQQVKEIMLESTKAFFQRISEKTNCDLTVGYDISEKFFKLYLEKNGVKYHDYVGEYVDWSVPKSKLKKHKNYVDAFMSHYNLRGKKIKKYMNQIKNIDWYKLNWSYFKLGIDYFNRIDPKVLESKEKTYSYYHQVPKVEDDLSNIEKSKIVIAINTGMNMATIIEHLDIIRKLKKHYQHDFKMRFTDLDSFNQEHYELSELYMTYRKGLVTRSYGDFAEEQIQDSIMGFNSDYYPVVLKTSFEFNQESQVQTNCVRGYVEKPNCIIISLRSGSKNSTERATIEYRFRRNEMVRVQSLGKFNKQLDTTWNVPMEILDKRLSQLWKKNTLTTPRMKKESMNGLHVENVKSVFIDSHTEPVWDKTVDNNHDDENLFFDFVG